MLIPDQERVSSSGLEKCVSVVDVNGCRQNERKHYDNPQNQLTSEEADTNPDVCNSNIIRNNSSYEIWSESGLLEYDKNHNCDYFGQYCNPEYITQL